MLSYAILQILIYVVEMSKSAKNTAKLGIIEYN